MGHLWAGHALRTAGCSSAKRDSWSTAVVFREKRKYCCNYRGWASVSWRQGRVSCGRQNFPHPYAPKWKTPRFTIVDLITLYIHVLFDQAILPTGKFLSDKFTFLEKKYKRVIHTYIFYTRTHTAIVTEAMLVITRDEKQVNIHKRNVCSHYIKPALDV